MYSFRNPFFFVVFLFLSSCARPVAFNRPDIQQYQAKIPLKAHFYMEKSLRDKMYSSRAFSSGIANRWDVPIGETTYTYAISYLKSAFETFEEIDTPNPKDGYNILIEVTDINYSMKGQAAHCDLNFVLVNQDGKEVWNKQYNQDGPSGFGRVLAVGAFGQKSAIRQSTHVVLENIFKNLVRDIENKYQDWEM